MPVRARVQERGQKRARSMGVRSGNFWKKAPSKPWPGKVFSEDYQRGRPLEYYKKSEDLWKGVRMTSVQAKGVLPATENRIKYGKQRNINDGGQSHSLHIIGLMWMS